VDASDGAKKIYTRTGDKGKTSLVGGARVSKSHLRLDAYGTVDELNSWLGVLQTEIAVVFIDPARFGSAVALLNQRLTIIQNDLFNVGSQLACEDKAMRAKLPPVNETQIKELETWMDEFSADLKPLKNFILPGGTRAASFAHVCRTICRRTERLSVGLAESGPEEVDPMLVQYLNRLSDFFFVLARHLNRLLWVEEPIWEPRT
jgi:cob(I)alamin adenosyltransferase